MFSNSRQQGCVHCRASVFSWGLRLLVRVLPCPLSALCYGDHKPGSWRLHISQLPLVHVLPWHACTALHLRKKRSFIMLLLGKLVPAKRCVRERHFKTQFLKIVLLGGCVEKADVLRP